MSLYDIDHTNHLLHQRPQLLKHMMRRLYERDSQHPVFPMEGIDWKSASAVLFLLGRCPDKDQSRGEPCLILTKRSANVRQPGDLCCPGGRVNRRLDAALATLFKFPLLPLTRWPYWLEFFQKQPREAGWLRLLLATGVREGIEEMRLNPFGLKFLGTLPAQPLTMFRQNIYPMVMWVNSQKRFYPNWEVDKIIYLPLKDLLNPAHYVRYQLRIETQATAAPINTFPCFRYEKENENELLWGATYRITTVFLETVFGFVPPDIDTLPEIHGRLGREYLTQNSR